MKPVFNSGLRTTGPHVANFTGNGREIFNNVLFFMFWGEQIWGEWLCWKLLSTDKMNPEHLSVEVTDYRCSLIYVKWVRLKDAYPCE